MRSKITVSITLIALVVLPFLAASPIRADDKKLDVVATTTDLRELCKDIGGKDVTVHCLTQGPEDPHFISARPSYIRECADADALVITGMDLEVGYVPLLLSESRNGNIQRGNPGYIDCSENIPKLEVPREKVDRSLGDVHPFGNPHYLLDPLAAEIAAKTIADHFAQLDPGHAKDYQKRLQEFDRKMEIALFGKDLVGVQKRSRLEARLKDGTLAEYLKLRGLFKKLGGYASELLPYAGRKVVVYHDNALYFLDAFHLKQIGTLEPKPGIPPSPRHLAELEKQMKDEGCKVVLYNVYQPADTARSVASAVGGSAVLIAHSPDAIPGTSTYFAMLKHNVEALVKAFKETGGKSQ